MNFESVLSQFESLLESHSFELAGALFIDQRSVLLGGLGTPDPRVREGRLLKSLQAFVASDACTPEMRHELLRDLLGEDFLFHRIEEGETPGSLVRTSALLLLYRIIVVSLKRKDDCVGAVEPAMLRYIPAEKDWRGVEDGIGAVHCLAHAADVLAILAYSGAVDHLKILREILAFLSETDPKPFTTGEDKRFGKAIAHLMRTLPPSAVLELVPESYYIDRAPWYLQNLSNALAAAYVNLDGSGYAPDVLAKIKTAIMTN